jgi:hypothetical protein
MPGLADAVRIAARRVHRLVAPERTGRPGGSAGNLNGRPRTSSGFEDLWWATCSCSKHRGHLSPTAHGTMTGTTDLQPEQRTRLRSITASPNEAPYRRANPGPIHTGPGTHSSLQCDRPARLLGTESRAAHVESGVSRTNSSDKMSGSTRWPLTKPTTVRPVSCSTAAQQSASIVS